MHARIELDETSEKRLIGMNETQIELDVEVGSRTMNVSTPLERRLYFAALAVVPLWILAGNFLVLLTVLFTRRLRTLPNLVIASLAVTDFLLALIVVPLGVYQLVNIFLSHKLYSFSNFMIWSKASNLFNYIPFFSFLYSITRFLELGK